jgi:hypothetical protein
MDSLRLLTHDGGGGRASRGESAKNERSDIAVRITRRPGRRPRAVRLRPPVHQLRFPAVTRPFGAGCLPLSRASFRALRSIRRDLRGTIDRRVRSLGLSKPPAVGTGPDDGGTRLASGVVGRRKLAAIGWTRRELPRLAGAVAHRRVRAGRSFFDLSPAVAASLRGHWLQLRHLGTRRQRFPAVRTGPHDRAVHHLERGVLRSSELATGDGARRGFPGRSDRFAFHRVRADRARANLPPADGAPDRRHRSPFSEKCTLDRDANAIPGSSTRDVSF